MSQGGGRWRDELVRVERSEVRSDGEDGWEDRSFSFLLLFLFRQGVGTVGRWGDRGGAGAWARGTEGRKIKRKRKEKEGELEGLGRAG
jgi:hypothetical protein